jgi:hypothetical protein
MRIFQDCADSRRELLPASRAFVNAFANWILARWRDYILDKRKLFDSVTA